jgi:HAD superfamily hydrolase (TIGR01509 family)
MLKKISADTQPETVVFIDDNQKNIEAAEEVGIHGILYTYKDHAHLKKS